MKKVFVCVLVVYVVFLHAQEAVFNVFDVEKIVLANPPKTEINFSRGTYYSDLVLVGDLVYKGSINDHDVVLKVRYSKKFAETNKGYTAPNSILDCPIEITNSLQVGKLLEPTFVYGKQEFEEENFVSIEMNQDNEKRQRLENDMNKFSEKNATKIDFATGSRDEKPTTEKLHKEKVKDYDKLLFIGARLGVSASPSESKFNVNYRYDNYLIWNWRGYNNDFWLSGNNDSYYYYIYNRSPFEFAPFVSVQLAKYFAVQTEAVFTSYSYLFYEDKNVYSHDKYELSRSMIMIPVLPSVTIGKSRIVKIFAGPHFNIVPEIWMWKWKRNDEEIKDVTYKMSGYDFKKNYGQFYNVPVGLTWGFSAGYRVFFDFRWSVDFKGTMFPIVIASFDSNGYLVGIDSYQAHTQRSKCTWSVGFDIGTINRK